MKLLCSIPCTSPTSWYLPNNFHNDEIIAFYIVLARAAREYLQTHACVPDKMNDDCISNSNIAAANGALMQICEFVMMS